MECRIYLTGNYELNTKAVAVYPWQNLFEDSSSRAKFHSNPEHGTSLSVTFPES